MGYPVTNRFVYSGAVTQAFQKDAACPLGAGRGLSVNRTAAAALYSRPWQISQAMPTLMLADRNPDPLGGRGHVDVIDLVFTP